MIIVHIQGLIESIDELDLETVYELIVDHVVVPGAIVVDDHIAKGTPYRDYIQDVRSLPIGSEVLRGDVGRHIEMIQSR